MARYSAFLGRVVEVQYRAGDICFPASGTFVGDSGRSIFLQQHYEQNGRLKNFRWEIPYQSVVRIEVCDGNPEETGSLALPGEPPQPAAPVQSAPAIASGLRKNAATAGAGSSLLPVSQNSKTA
jgi:hypothetical protein